MHKYYQNNIVSGKESYPILWIVGENIFYLGMWILAGYLLWPIYTLFGLPILTILWAITVVVIQILLKKHNCSGCFYYDKLCHLGWGKISSKLFKQDSGNPNLGTKLALFYIIPPPLILVLSIIFSTVKGTTCIYWAVLFFYIVLNIASFPIRKKSCGFCIVRKVCPGNAAKK